MVLTNEDKLQIAQRVWNIQNSETTIAFVEKASKAKIPRAEIDSLLFAKETFLFLGERIQDDASKRDSLYLFSENTGTLKRENFSRYRKQLATILSQEQFYGLYKDIVDTRAKRVVQHQLNALTETYLVNKVTKEAITHAIAPICKEVSLVEAYFMYDKKLAQYQKHLLEKQLAILIEEKTESLEKRQEESLFTSKDPRKIAFVKTAQKAGIQDSLIIEIVDRIKSLDKELDAIKKEQGVNHPDHLYTPYDHTFKSSEAYAEFETYLTSVLSIGQYRWLFWEQLSPKIEALAQAKFIALAKKYDLDDIEEKNKKLLKKWIKTFVGDELVVSHYYFRESSLAEVKVRRIQVKAENKYREILSKTTDKTIPISEASPRVAAFLANAKTQGVDMKKAQKIVQACLEYELRQEEIMMAKKYNKKYIYSLDNDNGKIRARDAFRRYLADNLTKSEYQKLFWEQLEPEINGRIRAGLAKIKDTYPKIKGKLFEDLRAMLQNQMTMETVARYYYSYDKKLAKQKVKALNYKYNKEYKEKMKQNTL